MRSIQKRLKEFYRKFNDLPCDVLHYKRQSKYPYVVWTEQGEDGYESFHGDGHKGEQVIIGAVNFFTRTEFDPTVDAIQTILDDSEDVAWTLDAVQYEDETNLIHYTWAWRLI